MKGMAESFSYHSSVISMVYFAMASLALVLRYSLACVIKAWVYSGMRVCITFQKYSRSGQRPLGSFEGKYLMKSSSFLISGQKWSTASSS